MLQTRAAAKLWKYLSPSGEIVQAAKNNNFNVW
jgi:hypothetical protein